MSRNRFVIFQLALIAEVSAVFTLLILANWSRYGQYSRNATTGAYSVDASTASAHADRAQLLAANTTVTRSTVAVGNNTDNRTVFWSPTAFVAARGVHDWPQAARVAAARPSYGASSCVLHSWGPPAARPTGDLVQCLNLWLEITMRNGTFRTLPFFAQGMMEVRKWSF